MGGREGGREGGPIPLDIDMEINYIDTATRIMIHKNINILKYFKITVTDCSITTTVISFLEILQTNRKPLYYTCAIKCSITRSHTHMRYKCYYG